MNNSADLGGCYPPRPSALVDNTVSYNDINPVIIIEQNCGGQTRIDKPFMLHIREI